MLHYENLQLCLRLKLKKIRGTLSFNQSQWFKPYIAFNTLKIIEVGKNNDKDGKLLNKLMNNAIHGKTIENLRNRNDVNLVNNEKDYNVNQNHAICCIKYLIAI